MIRIAAGELDRKVAILRSAEIDDGTAKVMGAPEVVARRWAKKIDIGDAERLAAAENGTTLASRFLVRADDLTRSIGGKYVLELRGRQFDVVGIKESTRYEDVIEITTASRSDQS